MVEAPIKITVSNGAIKHEISIEQWAVNSNTEQWLLDKVTEFIKEVLPNKD